MSVSPRSDYIKQNTVWITKMIIFIFIFFSKYPAILREEGSRGRGM